MTNKVFHSLSLVGLDYSIAGSERNESYRLRVLIQVQKLSTVLDRLSFPVIAAPSATIQAQHYHDVSLVSSKA